MAAGVHSSSGSCLQPLCDVIDARQAGQMHGRANVQEEKKGSFLLIYCSSNYAYDRQAVNFVYSLLAKREKDLTVQRS